MLPEPNASFSLAPLLSSSEVSMLTRFIRLHVAPSSKREPDPSQSQAHSRTPPKRFEGGGIEACRNDILKLNPCSRASRDRHRNRRRTLSYLWTARQERRQRGGGVHSAMDPPNATLSPVVEETVHTLHALHRIFLLVMVQMGLDRLTGHHSC